MLIVGFGDVIFDWYVSIDWILEGFYFQGAANIFFILLSGSAIIFGESRNITKTNFRWSETFLYLLGLSILFHSFDILCFHKNPASEENLKYTRVLEVLFESLPSGGKYLHHALNMF